MAVADKGMYTGDNIARIILDHNGYVISQSVRRAPEAVEKVGSRSKDKIDNRHGANKYLRTRVTDAGGNEVDGYGARIEFDAERLDEDEMADGYYIIETNVRGLRDSGD